KNPLVVLADADLPRAAKTACWAAFGNAGQRCTSLGNLILDEKIADAFLKLFMDHVRALQPGDPTLREDVDYGPLICERFLDGFLRHRTIAEKDGARLITERFGRMGKNDVRADFAGDVDNGLFVFPAVWDRVEIGMGLAQTEVFGPTVNVLRARD